MTNSKYNAHTDPLFKSLKLLKIKDIFDVLCMIFWYKFVNNNVPTYFASMFRYNHELYEIQTRSHESLHLYPFRTSNAHNALRHQIPELLCKFPTAILEKARTHSIMSFASHVKFHLIDYNCDPTMLHMCKVNVEIAYICTSKDICPVEIRTISHFSELTHLCKVTLMCVFSGFNADYS